MSSDTEPVGLLGPSEKLYERDIESEAVDRAGLVGQGKGKGASLVFDSRCRPICNFWSSVSKAFMQPTLNRYRDRTVIIKSNIAVVQK